MVEIEIIHFNTHYVPSVNALFQSKQRWLGLTSEGNLLHHQMLLSVYFQIDLAEYFVSHPLYLLEALNDLCTPVHSDMALSHSTRTFMWRILCFAMMSTF